MADNSKRKLFLKNTILTASLTIICVAFGIAAGFLLSSPRSQAETPINPRVAPEMLSASFAEIAKRVEPAVVNIDTKGKVPEVTLKGDVPGADDSAEIEEFKRQQSRRPSYSVGSGFIVDKSGYILTNYHVVEDASRILVRLQSGEEYTGKVIGTDEETDLAVVKIEAGRDLPTVQLGDSEAAQVGDWVLAIGSPFGLAQTVTAGIISQTKRETPNATAFQRFIQTDAAINRGNSGGPLVNMNGEVVGINSQIATLTGDYSGIGFALPSREVSYVYRQILTTGKVRRGYLGAFLDSVKPEYAKIYGLTEAKGAIVTELRDKQSAAALSGLQVNDVIVEFDNQPIAGAQDLIAKVASTEPAKEVTLVYLREVGDKLERRTTTLKLSERPSKNSDSSFDPPKKLGQNQAQLVPLGLTLVPLTPQLVSTYKLDGQKGVLIKDIDPASFIADVKTANGADALGAGDLIQRVNRQTVTDVKSFNEIVGKLKTGDAVILHVASYNRFSQIVQQRIVQFTIQ